MDLKALFINGDLGATLRAHLDKARRAADTIPESRFTASDPSAVATELYSEYLVEPLELTEGAISVEAHDADIDRRKFRDIDHGFPGASPTLRGTRVTYRVPYTGDPRLLKLRPSTFSGSLPRAAHSPSELQFVYEVPSSEVAGTKATFERDLSLTRRYVGWSNGDVGRFNEELRGAIEDDVNSRSRRLAEAAEGLATLGLPVVAPEPARVKLSGAPPLVPGRSGKVPAKEETFDVALSFAGEDRDYVEAVAEYLKAAEVRVFYDGFEAASLWGKDLVAHLQDIYQNRARYCVLFISASYVTKPWPRHESRSAQARALVADEEYLLPARFDDSVLPGLPPTIGFVDLRSLQPEEFGELVLKKLGKARPGG